MSTQGEFTVVAEESIDDDLTLLLAKGDGIPRLGIYNTYTDKKKYVPLSWIEGADRSLKIKVGRSTKEYSIDSIIEAVGELIKCGGERISLSSLAWRGVQLLGDLAHMPKSARSDVDLTLIADSKRDTLWFAYTPKRGDWKVRPCFISGEEERAVLGKYLQEGKPWPYTPIENGNLPYTMRNLPFVKETTFSNPARWNECLLTISRALLLGFSDWSAGNEHRFGEALWRYLPQAGFRSEESLNAVSSAGKVFLAKFIAYLRLWPVLNGGIAVESVTDVAKEGETRGLKKRERFEMTAPNLGDKRFRVTRFASEPETVVSFGITPETRLPGENDRMVTMPGTAWQSCLETCAMGGEIDPQYTCNSLLGAVEMRDWYRRICQCMAGQPMSEAE